MAECNVFAALLEVHPGPLSRAEIATILDDQIAAEDAVDTLRRDGLALVQGELVFASRAGVRADELAM